MNPILRSIAKTICKNSFVGTTTLNINNHIVAIAQTYLPEYNGGERTGRFIYKAHLFGDTYAVREILKDNGYTWDKNTKTFILTITLEKGQKLTSMGELYPFQLHENREELNIHIERMTVLDYGLCK